MASSEAMTSSTRSFAYSYRLVKKCFVKICETSKCHNFLIFQPIFIRFSLFCSKCFTLSSEIKLNLFRSSPLISASYKMNVNFPTEYCKPINVTLGKWDMVRVPGWQWCPCRALIWGPGPRCPQDCLLPHRRESCSAPEHHAAVAPGMNKKSYQHTRVLVYIYFFLLLLKFSISSSLKYM